MIFKFKDKKDFIVIAKDTAYNLSSQQEYLPKSQQELDEFVVHEWVLRAMDIAYTQGLEDAKIVMRGE